MAISKFKVDFDPLDPTNHDRVGSFIVGAAGEVATTTDLGGGVIGLDVNVANIVLGSDAGVFAEDAAAVSGDKGEAVLLVRQDTLAASTSADGDYGHFKSTDKGELYVHDVDALAMLTTVEGDLDTVNTNLGTINTSLGTINTSVGTVNTSIGTSNTSLAAINSDTTSINGHLATIDTNIASITSGLVADDAVSTEKPFLVGAVAASPASVLTAVSAGDKVHVTTDLHRRVFTNDSMAVAWQVNAVVVGTSAVQLDATPLATRRKVTIQNLSNANVYVKNANTVTSSNGILIPKNSERDLEFTAGLPIWAIASAAASDVRFLEMG